MGQENQTQSLTFKALLSSDPLGILIISSLKKLICEGVFGFYGKKKKYGVFGLRGELRKDVDIFGVFDF